MFVSQPVSKSFALLVFFISLLSILAQEKEEGDDSPLMKNYNALREEGQGFFRIEKTNLYEKPGSTSTPVDALYWWCDLEFSSDDATNNHGYVGRAVSYKLGSTYQDVVARGAQTFPSKKGARSVSAVLVPTLGIFEVQYHSTIDDWVGRYWDDGSSTLPFLGWEGHDEGDTSPNADTSAFSSFGTYTKITTEAAAELLGMDVAVMTPATCSMEYEAAWNTTHVPDPIDTSVTTLEENVAQLQVDNKALLSRIAAIEGSLVANRSGSSGNDGEATATSSSLFMAWYEHATMDIVMKSTLTVAVIIGLVAIDFI